MSNILHQSGGKKGAFYYEANGEKLAEMVYIMAGEEKMIIEHTEVHESLQGKGIGLKLLEALIDYVREHGIKVIPLCPFASAMLKKHTEWRDVLA